jgi:hypothetical protein
MKKALKVFAWVAGAVLIASIFLPAHSSVNIKCAEVIDDEDACQIYLALHSYALDNGGRFPPKLQDLVPGYLQEDFHPYNKNGPRLDEWLYFPVHPKDDPDPIILISPRLYSRDGDRFPGVPLFTQPHSEDSLYHRLVSALFQGSQTSLRLVVTLNLKQPGGGELLSESEVDSRMTKQLKATPTPSH